MQGRMHVARGSEGVRRMYPRTCPASCMYTPPYRVPSTWPETCPHRGPEGEYRDQSSLSAHSSTSKDELRGQGDEHEDVGDRQPLPRPADQFPE